MAELADALDLGSSISRCAGSSPVTRTIKQRIPLRYPLFNITKKQDLKRTPISQSKARTKLGEQSGGLFDS